MPEQTIKRSPEDDFYDEEADSLDLKRQELDQKRTSASSANTKPGRKPIDTEPKNKRTAQNRAAQRAFRERKERKMKELEDKVTLLEDEKKSMNTESEFLRMQVQMLMNELARHKGVKDFKELGLTLNLPVDQPNSGKTGSISSSSTTSMSVANGGSSSVENTTPESATQPFSFEFPWSRKNSSSFPKGSTSPLQFNSPNTAATGNSNNSNNNVNPGLASDCSTTCSAQSSPPFEVLGITDDNLITFPSKQQTNVQKGQGQGQTPAQGQSLLGTDFNFDDHFDEGISDFCADLNSACGTKACPLPTKSSPSKTVSEISTPPSRSQSHFNAFSGVALNPTFSINEELDQHINTLDNNNNSNSLFAPSSGITFDQSLAFSPAGLRDDSIFGFFDIDNQFNESDKVKHKNEEDEDALKGLISEESRYDPFGLFENVPLLNTATTSNNTPATSDATTTPNPKQYTIPYSQINELTKPSTTDKSKSNENEIVPNKEGRLLKCTEIWDRVTSHPRYSDIDIDGLCSELRAKAKCSDKGVVIDYDDVNKVINNSLGSSHGPIKF
ncbi:hypothetical protein WICPIJ_003464 [Wickerhamomyces pijperi]|uniref:BZIP domain-containing protein n=1 Tax=Wickerhamomyces pijperi TaxID=599730 RepID=A0A9P8TMZ8_WICPI|nr:hypothetical protein WICPIJ_003464 [Wickerhamomyces pijperi]